MTAPPSRAEEETRYTVVYEGDPAGVRILNGEPAPGKAVGVMLGDMMTNALSAEAEVARLKLRDQQMGYRVEAAEAQLEAAEARIAVLEAALRPFADEGFDDPSIHGREEKALWQIGSDITFGDIWRAMECFSTHKGPSHADA